MRTANPRSAHLTPLRPPFKCHGGKAYLKEFVLGQFPKGYSDMAYVEPFGGAASVLFNKQPGPVEVLSDIHPGIIAIHQSIRDEPDEFLKRLKAIPYTADTFAAALEPAAGMSNLSGIDLAVNEYVLRRMSRGGLKTAFAWSDRQRGGKPGDVNAWETALTQIPAWSERLRGVTISCDLGLKIIQMNDRPDVLAYLDPPYLHTTRTATNAYDFEMTEAGHHELLRTLITFRGKALLSGYDSELYNTMLASWTRVEREVANHSSQAKTKARKIEVLWRNY